MKNLLIIGSLLVFSSCYNQCKIIYNINIEDKYTFILDSTKVISSFNPIDSYWIINGNTNNSFVENSLGGIKNIHKIGYKNQYIRYISNSYQNKDLVIVEKISVLDKNYNNIDIYNKNSKYCLITLNIYTNQNNIDIQYFINKRYKIVESSLYLNKKLVNNFYKKLNSNIKPKNNSNTTILIKL